MRRENKTERSTISRFESDKIDGGGYWKPELCGD